MDVGHLINLHVCTRICSIQTLKGGGGAGRFPLLAQYMYMYIVEKSWYMQCYLSPCTQTHTHTYTCMYTHTHTIFSAGTTAKVNNLGEIQQEVPILACIGKLHLYVHVHF